MQSWVMPVDLVDARPSTLHLAVECGLLSKVERVLEENVDLEVRGAHDSLISDNEGYGWTLLQRAVYLGDHSIVDFLLSAGSDVNALSHFAYRNPLLAAVQSNNMIVVELLLQAISKFLQVIVVKLGNPAIVELLLGAGADINATAFDRGETPLCTALKLGNLAVAELLIQAGVDVNVPSGQGGSLALHIAIELRNLMIVKLLLEAGVDFNGYTDETVLCTVVKLTNMAIVELLLRAGADVNTPPHTDSETALCTAVKSAKVGIVELFLKVGAKIKFIQARLAK